MCGLMHWKCCVLYACAFVGLLTILSTCSVNLSPSVLLLSLSLLLPILIFPSPFPTTTPVHSGETVARASNLKVRFEPGFRTPRQDSVVQASSPSSSDDDEAVRPGTTTAPAATVTAARTLIWSPPHGAYIRRDRPPPAALLDHKWISKNPEKYQAWLASWST